MLGTRLLFEPGIYLNLGIILEIYGKWKIQITDILLFPEGDSDQTRNLMEFNLDEDPSHFSMKIKPVVFV